MVLLVLPVLLPPSAPHHCLRLFLIIVPPAPHHCSRLSLISPRHFSPLFAAAVVGVPSFFVRPCQRLGQGAENNHLSICAPPHSPRPLPNFHRSFRSSTPVHAWHRALLAPALLNTRCPISLFLGSSAGNTREKAEPPSAGFCTVASSQAQSVGGGHRWSRGVVAGGHGWSTGGHEPSHLAAGRSTTHKAKSFLGENTSIRVVIQSCGGWSQVVTGGHGWPRAGPPRGSLCLWGWSRVVTGGHGWSQVVTSRATKI